MSNRDFTTGGPTNPTNRDKSLSFYDNLIIPHDSQSATMPMRIRISFYPWDQNLSPTLALT